MMALPTPLLRRALPPCVLAAAALCIFAATGFAQSGQADAVMKAAGKSDVLTSITENVDITGLETQYDPDTGVASAVGEVHIKYGGVEIIAGRAEYNSNTKDVIAREDVTVLKEGQVFRGENVTYNFETQELKANDLRSGLPPIFYKTADLKANLSDKDEETGQIHRIDGSQTYFTTHDSNNPNYHLISKSLTIYPGDRIVMHDVKVYVGKTPVFWLPLFVQPLDNEQGYYFRPGYSSQWGAFLLNQYGVMYGDHTLAKYRLDLRSTRGVAGGVDLKSLRYRDKPHFGNLLIYYAYDTDPSVGYGHENRGPFTPGPDRYRISFQHRIYIPGPSESTWYLDFDLTKLSDEFMLEDYYLNEFRDNPNPDNNIALVKHDDRFTATLWSRFQMNSFSPTDQRLPELAFDFTRQRLGHTNVYYQGETSTGFYNEKLTGSQIAILQDKIKTQQTNVAGFDKSFTSATLGTANSGQTFDKNGQLISQATGINQLSGSTLTSNSSDFYRSTPRILTTRDEVQNDIVALQSELAANQFFRFHTYNEFLYPMSFGPEGFLTFVPRIGGGVSYYADASGGAPGVTGGTKGIFAAGFDLAARFSRTWKDVRSDTLGLDGLRHVIQPYINYSFLDSPRIDGLPTIDRLAPSTRPRPVDVPLFTAVDDLNSWNIARVGLRNSLQTKRDGTAYNWMGLNTYADIFFEDPEFDRKVSNLYNDFFWRPVPWLQFNTDVQLPIGSSQFNYTEINTGFSWLPNRNFSWSLGHAYVKDNPIFIDSNLLNSHIYARLNENWGFSMNHIYEAADHTLEYQSYSIHRDLSSWIFSLGGLIRQNRGGNGSSDIGVVFTMTLKDFPQVSLPLDLDPNPSGVGGH